MKNLATPLSYLSLGHRSAMSLKNRTLVVYQSDDSVVLDGVATGLISVRPDETKHELLVHEGQNIPKPTKKRRRKKRIRIGDALRREGLDEREIAKRLAVVIERQTSAGSDKQLAGTLMDVFDYLDDAPRSVGPTGGPASIKLVHDVPRPARPTKVKNEKQKGYKT